MRTTKITIARPRCLLSAVTALTAAAALTGCSAVDTVFGSGNDIAEPVFTVESTVAGSDTADANDADGDGDSDSDGGSGKSGSGKSGSTETRTIDVTTGVDKPVNPANYERAGMSIFSFDLGGYDGTCAISPHGVTCTGATPKDAPTVTAVPLPPRKADAIYAGEDGMHYTIFEGVGPAQGSLKPGQSIQINENFCSFPDKKTLKCRSGNSMSYTISADGEISPTGRVDDPPVWTLPDYY